MLTRSDQSRRPNIPTHLDRMGRELVDCIVLVSPHAKSGRGDGNLAYRAALIAGGILLAPWSGRALGEAALWTIGFYAGASLLIAMLAGLCLTWWARIYLGRFWSGVISRKERIRLLIRVPTDLRAIPFGLVIAVLATGVAEATIAALLGAGIMTFGFWLKEEQFLLFELGPDVYRAYCRRVPMLAPFTSSSAGSAHQS